MHLHEGFVRVEGMFNHGGARLTDLASVFHVRSAEKQIEQRHKWKNEKKKKHTKLRQVKKMGKIRGRCSAPAINRKVQSRKAKTEQDGVTEPTQSFFCFFYPTLWDILVAGKPQFLQSKSTLSATLNPATQSVLSMVNTLPSCHTLPEAGWKSSCRFIIACYAVYMTSQSSALTLLPMTHRANI